jgi:hypothetical protein
VGARESNGSIKPMSIAKINIFTKQNKEEILKLKGLLRKQFCGTGPQPELRETCSRPLIMNFQIISH